MSIHEHAKALRRPFTPEAVKWRADQAKPDAAGNVRCLVYIDSRLANERITDVDPHWTATYTFLAATSTDPIGVNQHAPTSCDLTVHGITRTGIGQLATKTVDAKHAKSAVSDAFKRAAVEFGVGSFLYALPIFKVDAKGYWLRGDGKIGGLTTEGTKQLRAQYAKVVNHPKFIERFGEPQDYGDVLDDERSATPQTETETEPAPQPQRVTGHTPRKATK